MVLRIKTIPSQFSVNRTRLFNPFRFYEQNSLGISHLWHISCMSRFFNFSSLYRPNITWKYDLNVQSSLTFYFYISLMSGLTHGCSKYIYIYIYIYTILSEWESKFHTRAIRSLPTCIPFPSSVYSCFLYNDRSGSCSEMMLSFLSGQSWKLFKSGTEFDIQRTVHVDIYL
jgi:hypothetical protein